MKKSMVRMQTLLMAGLLATAAAYAADAPSPAPAAPAAGGPGAGGPGRPGFRGGMGLDDTQREAYREAMKGSSADLAKLDEKMRAAQKELMKVVLAEKYDESAVRAKAEAVTKIQTDMMMLRAKAFSSVSPTLKPEQREAMENSPMGSMMIMGNGMGGGFRGGAMGPGGPGGAGGPAGGPRRPAAPGGPGAPGQ
jgi:Spy/CpxP family protein refolding chaperone